MCTFADVNAEDKLQLALIRIAQLEDELKAQTSRPDWTAREKELNDRHARELYDQKMFFKEMLEEQKESHRIEMDNLRKFLREESERTIQRLEESHKREIESLKAQQADSDNLQKREIAHLNKGMAELKEQLKESQLSEEEKGALARWWQRRMWRRPSEAKDVLNGRHPKNRQEQKDHMCDGSDDDITNPDGCNSQGAAAEVEQPTPNPDKKQKEKNGEKTRTDYSKNKPYTSNPTYIKLGDYYTLPPGGRFVNREGKPDTWLYRVLKRIPEHFEEIFYEVAMVTLPNGDREKTMEYDDQIIPGCCFDLDLIVFVLTEHFCYNTPFKGIVRKLNNLGLTMNDKTLGDNVHRIISYLRDEMSEVWEQEIMKTNYWMLDETPGLVGVTDKEGNKRYLNRYFWGIKAKLKKLCWFIYEHGSRGLKVIKTFLDNFIGFFTTDGYVVYSLYQDLYPDKHRSSCLYHMRRYFVDAIEENHDISWWFIDRFGELTAWEHEYIKQGKTGGEERRLARLTHSKKIMDKVKKELEKYARSNYKKLGKLIKRALVYAKKEWHAFEAILQNGDVEVSNNLCEQMMKHIKMNLKNCLNIGSEDSALDYAFMFSAIESCDINRLSPEGYLRKLILGLHEKNVEKKQLLPCYIRL